MRTYVQSYIRSSDCVYARSSGGTIITSQGGEDASVSNETNPVEVKRPIKELDQHNACGPDGISPFVLRECTETLVKLLVMFKISLNEGNVQKKKWKRAKVVPIIKKEKKKLQR